MGSKVLSYGEKAIIKSTFHKKQLQLILMK